MKIEIWSDIYCPFCYIGESYLKEALGKYPQGDKIELVYMSFELDPSLEKGQAYDTADYVAKKYHISPEQAVQNYKGIEKMGANRGLSMNFDQAIITNTFDGHRLIHWAADQGKMTQMVDRLFKAHFEDGLHVGDYEVLANLAAEIGLDKEQALEVLASNAYADKVKEDQEEGVALGINSVPFFVFDRKFSLSGAQPVELFEEAIEKAFGLEKGFQNLNSDSGLVCGPDGCVIK